MGTTASFCEYLDRSCVPIGHGTGFVLSIGECQRQCASFAKKENMEAVVTGAVAGKQGFSTRNSVFCVRFSPLFACWMNGVANDYAPCYDRVLM